MPGAPSDTALKTAAERFRRGLGLGIPILLGYVPVGLAFGMLAVSSGFTVAQAVACSATALAGAGQFIALAVMVAGGDVATVLAATGVVNLRYVLFGATIAPYLHRTRWPTQAALAFTLTDETFAVNITDLRDGHADEVSMLGVGVISWVGWVGGTLIGAAGGALVGDPSRFGANFAMPAMFTALLVAQAEDRRHVAVGALAALLALAAVAVLPGKWYIVVASMAAAAAGAVLWREPEPLPVVEDGLP